MTDTTDIEALRDAIRYCSIAKEMYGTEFQGAKFKLMKVATPELLSSILDQLEAERQRADEGAKEITYWCNLNARKNERMGELEAAEKEREGLQKALVIYGDEILELRAKLANPVVLPPLIELVNGGCILCGKLHPAGMQCPRLRVTSIKGD